MFICCDKKGVCHTMSNYNVYNVADWFLQNTESVSNKKLQKLVYYAYSWYLVLFNDNVKNLENKFFENKFEAWVHGAVYPELYRKYKSFGSNQIKVDKSQLTICDFSEDEKDVLNQVLEVYGKYTGNQLESICHQEEPWKQSRKGLSTYEPCNNLIPDNIIFNYYASRL